MDAMLWQFFPMRLLRFEFDESGYPRTQDRRCMATALDDRKEQSPEQMQRAVPNGAIEPGTASW